MYNKKVLSKIDLGKQTKKDPFKGDIIYDSMGQWKFPGQPTRIPSNEITMEGVPYPVYGIDNTGYEQMMYPGEDYTFPGNYVDEYPMAKKGGSLPKRPKKKNKKAWSRSIEATNILFTENPLFSQPKPRRNKVYDPNAKYFQEGGELPDDYQEFLDYSATAPENRQPGPGYFYGSPDEYDHYGMWEALGKPNSFEEALEMNPDWQQDEEGYYHGYSVNPYTGVFLKAGAPGLEEGDTKWMEIKDHYLSSRANESTPVYDTDLQRFRYIPKQEDGGLFKHQSGGRKPIYTNDPRDPRIKNYKDSLKLHYQGLNEKNAYTRYLYKNNFDVKNHLAKWSTDGYVDVSKHPTIGATHYGQLENSGGGYDRKPDGTVRYFTNYPKASGVQEKVYDDTEKGKILAERFGVYKKPVQPVYYKKPEGEKPIKTESSKSIVITDPKEYKYRKAMYDDSLNLYKAYQFQKSHINPKPRVKDFVDMYNKTSREYPELRRPGQPKTMTIEQIMKERKTNFNKRLPKYTHKDYSAVKKNPRGDFDPMDKRVGDYKIQGYYKSLPFNYDIAIGVHSSPDIWHSKINPSGSYFDGIAYSPKYKKPVEPVEFGESEFIESKPVLPKQVISESVQTENMLPVQMPQRDKMVMSLGRWYNNESAYDTSPEGGQTYYGEFEKIIDPSSGKVRYVPTGKKSEFRTLHDPTFQDGGEMYDASGLTPFIKAQTGLVATGEEDLYSAGELEPVTVKAEMPDWARFQEEYQNIKPLESYIAEEKKKYLRRGNKALNKMAGVTETNFPKDVEERFRQEYNQKMNTYATRKLGKKQGFNPRRRGEWVDELSPREFDVVAQSNYGSKLQPSVWTRTLSGLRSAYNVLPGPDMLTPIAGMTERENREALTNPLEGLEVLAPTDLPGIAIANAATNANPNIVKPNPFSGETMANVNPLATVGLNPLTIVDLAALPGLASGIYRGTKAAGKALEKGSRAGVRMAGNTLKKFVDERKYSKYKPEFATLEDVPTEDELKRLSEIEKAASVKTYNFKKTSPPQLDFYNTYEDYLNAVDEFNQNLKTVKNYVNKSTLPDEDIENIFGIGKKQILNAKEAQPVPNAPAVQSPSISPRSQREQEIMDMMQATMQPEAPRAATAAFRRTLSSLISDTEGVNLNTQEYQELDNLYRELVNEINTHPNAYSNEDYNDLNQLYRNLNRNYDNLYNVSNDISELSPDVVQSVAPAENARTLSQGVESLVRNVDDKVNEPVSATDIRTGMEQKREMPALSPNERLNVKPLVPSLFANDFKNPREMLKFVTNKLDEGIKDAEVGDIVTGSANTSQDSYLIQMDYIFKNAGKDGLSEPVFLGYEPMNTMGFLSKTKGVTSDDIYKKINAHLNNLQKRTGKSLNLKTHPPMISDDPVTGPMIMIPQYGLKKVSTNVGKLKKKKEGGIVSELSQKEINDLIAQGYIIEEV
jgi:hypothetical protein